MNETRLNILHLEDDEFDAELAASALKAAEVRANIHLVKSRVGFEAALTAHAFDLILSDYNIPGFDGQRAHELAKRLCPDVPFIFVSGALGDEVAVDLLKDGATDVVVKDRISRLPLAVERATREADERLAARLATHALHQMHAELENRVATRTAELAASTDTMQRQRDELDRAKRDLQAILDHAPALISVTDTAGRIQIVNHAAAAVTDLPEDRLVGLTVSDLFGPDIADELNGQRARVLAEGRPITFEQIFPVNGDRRHFSVSRFPLRDRNEQITAVGDIALDITSEKRAEADIQEARREALRANHAKSLFLSRISHELRTPLNAILGFAQLFEPAELNQEQRENIEQIVAGGRHLLELINEVIDISRIETGELATSVEPIAVEDAVSAATSMIQPLADQRGIRVTTQPPPSPNLLVRADRQRLIQVLLNLLSNAVKYNRPAGSIEVGVALLATERVRITVTDTGPGISPSMLPLLFEPFERLGAETTTVEGTGLGLPLAKALCEAMGGAIGVQSGDAGTTFWVELASVPTGMLEEKAAVGTPGPEVPEPHQRSEAATIVYVEDNAANLRLMERIVARRPGLTLLHAPDGPSGVALVRERRPGLVLLDLQLPGMGGAEVLRLLLTDPLTQHIPVVVLTADATPGLSEHLRATGAASCMTKPLDIPILMETIERMLSRTRTEDGRE